MNINELNMLKIPTGKRQTSWAFTGITKAFNSIKNKEFRFSLLKYLFYCLSYLSSWWSEWDLNLWPADFMSDDLTT